jgi:CheY-like chemotaxis protein
VDGVALRCLIVDDHEDFLISASRLLTSQGLEIVATASSAAEALELAGRLDPDVVLVDVQLGEENGLDVARQLSVEPRRIPVILISTHAQDDVADLVADSPAVGFLPKTGLSADAIARLLA